jgi:ketosteroid isomerase-like protein
VLARWCWNASGQQSGIGGELRYSEIVTYREAHAILIEHFRDHAEALKAVGLEGYAVPEKPTTPDLEELVRSNVDAYNRRDFDAVFATYSQHAVWDTSSVGLGVYEGRDRVRAFLEDWIAPYEDFEAELEEVRDLGNGVVFYVLRHRGRPAGGGGLVDLRHGYTAVWADGLFEGAIVHVDIDEGRAAAERLAEERR